MTQPLTPLIEYREANGLSQPDFAKKLGVGRSTVHRWESGARKIDRKRLSLVSEKTGIPARELRPDLAELFGAGQ